MYFVSTSACEINVGPKCSEGFQRLGPAGWNKFKKKFENNT